MRRNETEIVIQVKWSEIKYKGCSVDLEYKLPLKHEGGVLHFAHIKYYFCMLYFQDTSEKEKILHINKSIIY